MKGEKWGEPLGLTLRKTLGKTSAAILNLLNKNPPRTVPEMATHPAKGGPWEVIL